MNYFIYISHSLSLLHRHAVGASHAPPKGKEVSIGKLLPLEKSLKKQVTRKQLSAHSMVEMTHFFWIKLLLMTQITAFYFFFFLHLALPCFACLNERMKKTLLINRYKWYLMRKKFFRTTRSSWQQLFSEKVSVLYFYVNFRKDFLLNKLLKQIYPQKWICMQWRLYIKIPRDFENNIT